MLFIPEVKHCLILCDSVPLKTGNLQSNNIKCSTSITLWWGTTPGNETKEMFPFVPLILSKVNSYEDTVIGKFKSPFLNFRAVCLLFLSFLAKYKSLFFNMNYGFFWASITIHQHVWVVHGVLQDREEKPGLLSKHMSGWICTLITAIIISL